MSSPALTGMSNPMTRTAVYNADNQLTNWNGASLAGACPERSRRDANGNMTGDARFASRMELRDGTNAYTWDARNQLDSISGVTTASFEYGPFGRRQSKTINGTTTDFLYDGENPVQELSGGSTSANLLTGLNVDEYFQRTDSTSTSDFLTDALGSTLALADASGTVQTQYTYDPYGATTTQGTGSTSSFQFTGRENDGDGLYYYRARYYDPTLSRFIGQDPCGLPGADANLYAYVWSSPADFIDPFGWWGFGIQGGASAGAGVGAGVVGSVSGGVGVFGGNGLNAWAYGTSGGFAGVGPYNFRYPNAPGNTGYVVGYGADARAGVFATNATSVQQLRGPFRNFTIGGGVLFGGEVEVAWANGTWIVSLSGTVSPLPWPSAMASLMNTMTSVHCFGYF